MGQQDLELIGGLAEVRDDGNGGRDDLAGLALLVNLAQAAPLAERGGEGNLDERDALLGATRAAAPPAGAGGGGGGEHILFEYLSINTHETHRTSLVYAGSSQSRARQQRRAPPGATASCPSEPRWALASALMHS